MTSHAQTLDIRIETHEYVGCHAGSTDTVLWSLFHSHQTIAVLSVNVFLFGSAMQSDTPVKLTPLIGIFEQASHRSRDMYVQCSVGPGWASGRAFQLQEGGGAGGFSCAQRSSPPHSGRFSASASLQDKKCYVKTQNDASVIAREKRNATISRITHIVASKHSQAQSLLRLLISSLPDGTKTI